MGDPIFTGFDGVKFEFQGETDKFYNLIAAPDHQVRRCAAHGSCVRRSTASAALARCSCSACAARLAQR